MNIVVKNVNVFIFKKSAYFTIELNVIFPHFVTVFNKFLENPLFTRFSLYIQSKRFFGQKSIENFFSFFFGLFF